MANCILIVLLLASVVQAYTPLYTYKNSCSPEEIEIFESGVSKEDQDAIITQINLLRQRLNNGDVRGQPKAKYLKNMTYSETLAEVSQTESETCRKLYHRIMLGSIKLGQTKQSHESDQKEEDDYVNWSEIIARWASMSKYFTYPDKVSRTASLYIQLAHEKSTKVGCGYTYYKHLGNTQHAYNKLCICTFNGRISFDEAPYEADDDDD